MTAGKPPVLLAISELHAETELAHELFRSGHYRQAVREAAERFIARVKERALGAGAAEVARLDGSRLIARVFAGSGEVQPPILILDQRNDRLGRDNHEGYRALALGLTRALRNIYTHEVTEDQLDPNEALEWLAFISAMHRRLDRAIEADGFMSTGDARD